MLEKIVGPLADEPSVVSFVEAFETFLVKKLQSNEMAGVSGVEAECEMLDAKKKLKHHYVALQDDRLAHPN